jgi:hypothetical protein
MPQRAAGSLASPQFIFHRPLVQPLTLYEKGSPISILAGGPFGRRE